MHKTRTPLEFLLALICVHAVRFLSPSFFYGSPTDWFKLLSKENSKPFRLTDELDAEIQDAIEGTRTRRRRQRTSNTITPIQISPWNIRSRWFISSTVPCVSRKKHNRRFFYYIPFSLALDRLSSKKNIPPVRAH